MTTDKYQTAKTALKNLLNLLEDQHPGLFTWCEAVSKARQEVLKELQSQWITPTPIDASEKRLNDIHLSTSVSAKTRILFIREVTGKTFGKTAHDLFKKSEQIARLITDQIPLKRCTICLEHKGRFEVIAEPAYVFNEPHTFFDGKLGMVEVFVKRTK